MYSGRLASIIGTSFTIMALLLLPSESLVDRRTACTFGFFGACTFGFFGATSVLARLAVRVVVGFESVSADFFELRFFPTFALVGFSLTGSSTVDELLRRREDERRGLVIAFSAGPFDLLLPRLGLGPSSSAGFGSTAADRDALVIRFDVCSALELCPTLLEASPCQRLSINVS